MIHASNKKASHRLVETPPRPPRRPPASPPTLRQALELCHFDQSRHVYIEGSETQLSFGESSSFATEIHFYCEPVSEPIQPPGHQQGPTQWHGSSNNWQSARRERKLSFVRTKKKDVASRSYHLCGGCYPPS